MKRRIWSVLLGTLLVLALTLGVAACGDGTDYSDAGAEAGEYYCEIEGREDLLTLFGKSEYTLTIGGGERSGHYRLEGGAITLEGEEPLTGTVSGDKIDLNYGGSAYRFLRKVMYTVTFDSLGGSKVDAAQVLNGKPVKRPADPAKEGSAFVGWFTDAALQSEYAFSTPVTGNLTLYAKYVQAVPGEEEFTVNFDLGYEGGQTPAPVKTTGGKLYSLPTPEREGAQFAGWWVSHFGSREKLTYRYENQTLEENITLFAVWADGSPLVSVNEKGASWTAEGVNNNYNVTVTAPDGSKETSSQGATDFAYNFGARAEGEYRIDVELRGKTATAYYKNKGLARVSLFSVEGNLLKYNAVKNATKYLLTIECGSAGHDHARVDNGIETTYDFSDCDMREGGIVFTVTAEANGFVSSRSEAFVFDRTLEQAAGLTVSAETDAVHWNAVPDATGYLVCLKKGGSVLFEDVVNGTEFSLKAFGKGNYTLEVTPVAHGYNSPEASSVTYDKARIATPSEVRLTGETLTWEEVEGAAAYEVDINGKQTRTENALLQLTEADIADGAQVRIRALGSSEAEHSLWSDVLRIRGGEMGELSYGAGIVSWEEVFGAVQYAVRVNGENEQLVPVSSAKVTFTLKGDNKIEVCAIYQDGNRSAWAEKTVYAYEIKLDTQDGKRPAAAYKADGDPMEFPSFERAGYGFGGWYTAPGEDGKAVGGTFTQQHDLTLYAKWDPNEYEITFEVGNYGAAQMESRKVKYGEMFTLPTPQSNDVTKAFIGWYTESNAGLQYTDFEGKSLDVYLDLTGRTLYARWGDIFVFKKLTRGYSVSKGDAVGFVTSLTIPAEYLGETVTTIEDFSNCSTLETINFYDTVEVVTLTSAGVAFSGCSNLKNVNVLTAPGNHDKNYSSVEGVLFYDNPVTGLKELRYFPVAREGSYDIPDGTQLIPSGAFRNVKALESVTVAASVQTMEKQAFYSCSVLENVSFRPTLSGEIIPLELRSQVFYSCANLTEITLPDRVSEIAADALTSLGKLTRVNVEGGNGKYTSVDGLLCLNTDAGKELIFYPKGRGGTFRVPSQISVIGKNAFKSNTTLTQIMIPGSVTHICESAFESCNKITQVIFEGVASDPDLQIDTRAFYSCSGLTEMTLPANLVKLAANVFYNNKDLKTVNVYSGEARGSNVRKLEFANNAFSGTTAVTTVNLGAFVPEMDIAGVFGSALRAVNVAEGNLFYASDKDGVLFYADMSAIVYYPAEREGAYEIPQTVTKIAAQLFKSKKGLTKIVIPASVVDIGESAFDSCTALEEVEFKPGTTSLTIGKKAFYQCSALETIVLPEGTTSIGMTAFARCYALKSFTIPASVDTIEFYYGKATAYQDEYFYCDIFSTCDELQTIEVKAENPNYMAIDGVLYVKKVNKATGESYPTELIYCPLAHAETVNVPETVVNVWNRAFYDSTIKNVRFAEQVKAVDAETGEQSDGSLVIEEWAFYSSDVESVTFPKGLSTIKNNAFYYCQGLTELSIPNTVTLLCDSAFHNCTGLVRVTFEEGGSEALELEDGEYSEADMGDESITGVFYYCTSLNEIELPARTSYIGISAFVKTAITEFTIPRDTVTLGGHVFYKCDALVSVEAAEGCKLKEIGGYAAYLDAALRHFELPEGLETIGNSVFSGTSVEDIELPSTIISIGSMAFYNNTGLTELVLPEKLETIGSSAFGNNVNLRSVAVKANSALTTLDTSVFNGDKALETVDFGEGSSLKTIGKNVFYNCTSLGQIIVPASVETIGETAFYGCASLESLTFADGSHLKEIGKQAFMKTALKNFDFPVSTQDTIKLGVELFKSCTSLTKVYLSKSVTAIDNVFLGCGSLKTIQIDPENENFSADDEKPIIFNKQGDTVRLVYAAIEGTYEIDEGSIEIGSAAFYGQAGVKTVIIPASVRIIGENAFKNCIGLEQVIIDEGSALTSIGQYAFASCKNLQKIELEHCSHLTALSGQAFQNCASLKEIDLSATRVTQLGHTASYGFVFDGCASLSSVKLPETLTSINNYSFSDCRSLESINVPASVKTLGSYAFYHAGLTQIDLSKTQVTVVASHLFDGAEKLKTVRLSNAVDQFGTYCFLGSGVTEVTVPSSLKTFSTNAFQDCKDLETIDFTGCASLTALANYAFTGCSSLREVKLGPAIAFLGMYAFQDCTSLRELDLSHLKELKGIGTTKTSFTATGKAYTFGGCTNLRSVTLPEECTKLSGYVFADCTALETVNLDHVTQIGTYCFTNTSFRTFTIPKSVTTVSSFAFANCALLEEVIFEEGSLKSLGDDMFSGCVKLERVTLPSSVTHLGLRTFQNCTSLRKIDLSATKLTCLGVSSSTCVITSNVFLFDGCTALEEVVVPETLTKIGGWVFRNCIALESFDLSNIVLIGDGAFCGSGLTSVEIPAELTTIGYNAFGGCVSLKEITVDGNNPNYSLSDGGVLIDNDGHFVSMTGGATLEDGKLVLPEGTTLGSYCFAGVTGIDTLVLPSDLTEIPQYAFQYSDIKHVIIPASVTTIGNYAFQYSYLEDITIPSTVTAMGSSVNSYVFRGSAIKEVNIQTAAFSKAGYCFDGATQLQKVTLADGITEIPTYAFRDAKQLKSIVLPASVTKIGNYAFANTGITDIELPANLTEIGTYVFNGSMIESIHIPASVTKVNNSAFENAVALKEVVFEDGSLSATSSPLGTACFAGCVKLGTVVLPDSLTTIAARTFENCTAISHLVIPESVTAISMSTTSKTVSPFAGWLPSQQICFKASAFEVCATVGADWMSGVAAEIIFGYNG